MGLPILGSVLSLGEKLIERLIPDPKQKAEALQRLAELEQAGDLAVIAGQVEINKIEAANTNMFIAGWRPACGWLCVSAFGLHFMIAPLAEWIAALAGQPVQFPRLDMSQMSTILIGMLGLGGMRTVEKLSGAEARR